MTRRNCRGGDPRRMLNEREDEEQTRRRRATADTHAHTPLVLFGVRRTRLMTMAITGSSREERLRFQRFTLDFERPGTKEHGSLGSFSTRSRLPCSSQVFSLNLQRTLRFRAKKKKKKKETKKELSFGEKGNDRRGCLGLFHRGGT